MPPRSRRPGPLPGSAAAAHAPTAYCGWELNRRLAGSPRTSTGVVATVSVPREPVKPLSQSAGTAGRLTADGRRIYRLSPPLVIWWIWVAVIVFSLGDLVFQGNGSVSLTFVFGLLTVTGLVFACTFWSKVIASDDGITVLNPFRTFSIPWGAVRGIFLADSVEVLCARSGGKKDKTIYSWALSSPRRARARQQLRSRQMDRGQRSSPTGYGRMPGQAKELVKMTPAEVMAREMAGISEQVQAKRVREGGTDGPAGTEVVSVRWAWPALAAVLLPAIAFVLSVVIR
jgi:hypothetical protein